MPSTLQSQSSLACGKYSVDDDDDDGWWSLPFYHVLTVPSCCAVLYTCCTIYLCLPGAQRPYRICLCIFITPDTQRKTQNRQIIVTSNCQFSLMLSIVWSHLRPVGGMEPSLLESWEMGILFRFSASISGASYLNWWALAALPGLRQGSPPWASVSSLVKVLDQKSSQGFHGPHFLWRSVAVG